MYQWKYRVSSLNHAPVRKAHLYNHILNHIQNFCVPLSGYISKWPKLFLIVIMCQGRKMYFFSCNITMTVSVLV